MLRLEIVLEMDNELMRIILLFTLVFLLSIFGLLLFLTSVVEGVVVHEVVGGGVGVSTVAVAIGVVVVNMGQVIVVAGSFGLRVVVSGSAVARVLSVSSIAVAIGVVIVNMGQVIVVGGVAILLSNLVLLKELCDGDLVRVILQELDFDVVVLEDIVLLLGRLEELVAGLCIEQEVGDGQLKELRNRDVSVLLKILGDSGLIGGKELGDGHVQELRHGDVVRLEEAR